MNVDVQPSLDTLSADSKSNRLDAANQTNSVQSRHARFCHSMRNGWLLGCLLLSWASVGCTLLGCKSGRPWIGNPFASNSNKLVLPDPPSQWAANDDKQQADARELVDQRQDAPNGPANMQLVAARGGVPPSNPVLIIDGVQPGTGTVRIAIFKTPESFPDRTQASQLYELQPEKSQLSLPLPSIAGEPVAIGVFQDLDDNGDLNRGAFGIPQEPNGFSGKASSTMGPPSFAEASVALDSTDSSRIQVQLK